MAWFCVGASLTASHLDGHDRHFGLRHQVGADLAFPLVVHQAGGIDQGRTAGVCMTRATPKAVNAFGSGWPGSSELSRAMAISCLPALEQDSPPDVFATFAGDRVGQAAHLLVPGSFFKDSVSSQVCAPRLPRVPNRVPPDAPTATQIANNSSSAKRSSAGCQAGSGRENGRARVATAFMSSISRVG